MKRRISQICLLRFCINSPPVAELMLSWRSVHHATRRLKSRLERGERSYIGGKYVLNPFTRCPGGGGVTPLFGLYGDVPLDRVCFFGLAVLTFFCPKQGQLS